MSTSDNNTMAIAKFEHPIRPCKTSNSFLFLKCMLVKPNCYLGLGPDNLNTEIRLGKLHTNKPDRGKEQIVEPKGIFIHPYYSVETFDNDVALIQLSRRVTYTDYVRPICLPMHKIDADVNLLKQGKVAVISGKTGAKNCLWPLFAIMVEEEHKKPDGVQCLSYPKWHR